MPFNCVALNCHSIIHKKPEISQFLLNKKIQVACFSETWLKASDNFSIPNFICYRVDRPYGGVCILVSNKIKQISCKKISLPYAESIFLTLCDSTHNISFSIGAVYCSPATTRAQAHDFFTKSLSINGPFILAGDFNAKHQAWNNTKSCRKGTDLFKLCNHKNLTIHPPDRPTNIPPRGTPAAIDFAISKDMPGVSDIEVLNALSSDHLPLSFSIPSNGRLPSSNTVFNFRKANWRLFRDLMAKSSSDIKTSCQDLSSNDQIDECVSRLTESISTAANSAIPKKKPYSFKYPYSAEIHNLVKYRNQCRSKFFRTLHPAYKSLTNQANRLIRRRTSELNQKSFNDRIANLLTHDGSLFAFTKCLKNKKSYFPPLRNPNDSLAYTGTEKAETLAKNYLKTHLTTADMTSKNERKVQQSCQTIDRDKTPFPNQDLVKVFEIELIIKELKVRKASGPDLIANKFIKNLPRVSILLLQNLFNACLRSYYFPSSWKIAKIIAIAKPGKDPTVPASYRPISLLSNIGKMFEKIILKRLSAFESEKDLFIPQQFGFRTGHSTVQQVLRITEHATINFNKNRSTAMVLLDIEKAFDCVWHQGLLHKLLELKFPMHLIKIIKSYLTNRQAFVEILGDKSAIFSIPAGVPQGSLLSPFLFNIFINDIKKSSDYELAIYADDTALFCNGPWKNVKGLATRITKACTEASQFFSDWKIRVNNQKTEFILFSKSTKALRTLDSIKPVLNGTTFDWQKTVTYLGVKLDQKLLFKNHIEGQISKAKKVVGLLYSLMKRNSTVSQDAKITIYRSLIRPIMSYASPVFTNVAKTHFNKFQVQQNKCLRMALNAPFFTRTAELHKQAKIPTFREHVDKITESFYTRAESHTSEIINRLGSYRRETLPFRLKHKLPLPI